MIQVLTTVEALQVTSSGTTVTTFDDYPARLINIQAPTSNSGTVTITKPGGSAGIVLAAGDSLPPQWLDNLNRLAYITSTWALSSKATPKARSRSAWRSVTWAASEPLPAYSWRACAGMSDAGKCWPR